MMIQRIARKLGYGLGLDEVILFGSRAKGYARKKSDIDLILIKDWEVPPPFRDALAGEICDQFPVGIHVHCFTKDEVDLYKQRRANFLYDAMSYGEKVFEKKRDQKSLLK